MNLSLKEVNLDKDEVFKDPRHEAREWLEKYNEERGGEPVSQKTCPQCSESVEPLKVKCAHCGADLRDRCEVCDLPLSGEEPLCHCEGFESEEEREAFFRQSPRSRRANRPGGGSGHYWLRARRASSGY